MIHPALAAAASLLVFTSQAALAQVYKCAAAGGRIEYRSVPCDAGTAQRTLAANSTPVPAPPTTRRAAPISALADPASQKNQGDVLAAQNCEQLQNDVGGAEREIERYELAVRQAAVRSPGRSSADDANARDIVAAARARIAEHRRQGQEQGCERFGIVVGSAAARAALKAHNCKNAQKSLAHWLTGPGKGDPRAKNLIRSAEDDLALHGCKG